MDSRTRHDVRHPIATISMIASTVAEFGESIDESTLTEYRTKVRAELGSLGSLLEQFGLEMGTEGLVAAASPFVEGKVSRETATRIARECERLLEDLKRC